MREGGRGKEGARTGCGNSNDVVVACRQSKTAMAHNLKRIRTAMVRLVCVAGNIATWFGSFVWLIT